MGLYSLIGIVFMMLATIVVTREPDVDSDLPTPRKKRSDGQRRRAGESLSMVGGPTHR